MLIKASAESSDTIIPKKHHKNTEMLEKVQKILVFLHQAQITRASSLMANMFRG